MISRRIVSFLLFVTVVSPLILFKERLGTFTQFPANREIDEEITVAEYQSRKKELIGNIHLHTSSGSLPKFNSTESDSILEYFGEHKSRVLSAADNGAHSGVATGGNESHIDQITSQIRENAHIEQVTSQYHKEKDDSVQKSNANAKIDQASNKAFDLSEEEKKEKADFVNKEEKAKEVRVQVLPRKQREEAAFGGLHKTMETNELENNGRRRSRKAPSERQISSPPMPDANVRHMKDQLIRARVYESFGSVWTDHNFIRELRTRVKEIQRALGDATKDSDLPRNAYEKLKAMEKTLARGKQNQEDCSGVVKKLRAMLQSTEEQMQAQEKQTMFLNQLAAETLPKGLHCLPLRLSSEYYSLNRSQQELPYQQKLEDSNLYHYALFSDNVLATSVVVNSTIVHAKDPEKHVFHIVTDTVNYAAMKMWFLANPPGDAAVQVQNLDEFTWLNASYSPVLMQLGSPSMKDYYFRGHPTNIDTDLKYRNPKYISILNHLRFYLPEIFPKLHKVLFLDDDVVVQKDLTPLWSIDLQGKINGAVETCQESFHRFDKYLNFSNPLIAKNFDPQACGWAYGMNIFDLKQWRKHNVTELYHSWQKLNHERLLWRLGTLPPGLLTFWKQTFALERSWHVLGLGYNPSIDPKEIERAAVIHYNGNMKPWLEISMPKYRQYWTNYVDYDQAYLRECNINP
ncbi:probable galacturonosyltransferase 4 [Nymphaea colorata]|nr:probable galacturonosyltransferase 4 [Nymphaea colorata]